jgi:hypothetical protein
MYRASKSKQESQILISVLLVTVIVFSLGAALLFHVRSYHDIAELQRDTDQAYALAKSGIEIADRTVESILDQGPCNYTKDDTYTLGAGTVRIQIDTTLQNIAGEYRVTGSITSTGCVDKSQHVLEKTIDSPISGWAKTYGGDGREYLRSIYQTSGGYILGAETTSFGPGALNALLIKTDTIGNVGTGYPNTWAKTYGTTGVEYFGSLQEVSDGYIFHGITRPAGHWLLLFVKTDSAGEVTWAKTYTPVIPESGTDNPVVHTLQQISLPYPGYILGANYYSPSTSYDFNLIKTNTTGEVGPTYTGTWAKTYGGSSTEYIRYLQQTSDEGYIVGGWTYSFGATAEDFLVVKTNSAGDVGPTYPGTWAKTYDGGWYDRFYSVQEVSTNDGYIVAGYTSLGPGWNFLVIRTNSAGDVGPTYPGTWAKTYGGNAAEWLYMFDKTSDGGYILGGLSNSFGGTGNDFLQVKIDDLGNVDWAVIYGSSYKEELKFLQQISDRGYILGGDVQSSPTNYDLFVMNTDTSGDAGCCAIITDVTDLLSTVDQTAAIILSNETSNLITNDLTSTISTSDYTSSIITTDETSSLTVTPLCPQ